MIEVAKMGDQHSFFVNPSRNERNRHKGKFTPTEVMNTLMGHMIGGRGRTRVMGTSIKSRDSVIVRLDLSNTPSDEGRPPLSTFASFLHTNGAMVMCTSKDGALITSMHLDEGANRKLTLNLRQPWSLFRRRCLVRESQTKWMSKRPTQPHS